MQDVTAGTKLYRAVVQTASYATLEQRAVVLEATVEKVSAKLLYFNGHEKAANYARQLSFDVIGHTLFLTPAEAVARLKRNAGASLKRAQAEYDAVLTLEAEVEAVEVS
jgi:tRNA G37 N-methylase Trm5